MANVKAPGIIINDLSTPTITSVEFSSSVGALVGYTEMGPINTPTKVTSWSEYISKFAKGMKSPFLTNYYLAYAVYGFFANGGKELYILSVKTGSCKKASVTGTTSNSFKIEATSEGAWGNSLKVEIKKSPAYEEGSNKEFDVTLILGNTEVAKVTGVYFDTIEEALSKDSTFSSFVTFTPTATLTGLSEATLTLTGGNDGKSLEPSDYVDSLSAFDNVEDLTMISIPESPIDNPDFFIDYCEEHNLYPISYFSSDTLPSNFNAVTKRSITNLKATKGSVVFPIGRMIDPLTGKEKSIPLVGHIMGVYARIIESRGVHKAPAGIEAIIKGISSLEYDLKPEEIANINDCGVIPIVNKPNVGIVIWGARMINLSDDTMKYVSDGLLNVTIKRYLYQNTQYAVFEPNTEQLWSSIKAVCESYLESLRQKGALKGSQSEAYYVIVDSSNNTDETINAGKLNIEIGYAPVKPAEFVTINLAHSILSE